MANSLGNKPQMCPHGNLGIKKCKECSRAYNIEYNSRPENQKKTRDRTSKWAKKHREQTYARKAAGIPVESGVSPTGTCLLCHTVETLVPDHCHTTGRMRGWICGRCNRALGVYEAYRPMIPLFDEYLSSTLVVGGITSCDGGQTWHYQAGE